MLRTDLLTFGVTHTVFKIAGEMHRLPAYFNNPDNITVLDWVLRDSNIQGFCFSTIYRYLYSHSKVGEDSNAILKLSGLGTTEI